MKITRRHSNASAIIVILALLGIVSLYILANARTLARLKHDVKRIEIRQLERLSAYADLSAGITNSPGQPPLGTAPLPRPAGLP